MPLRELVERALRRFISEQPEPERRASALHAMEEARELARSWKAKAEAAQGELDGARSRVQQLENEAEQERRLRRRAEERVTWAMMHFEAQRGFSKRPLSEFLAQFDREHPA